MSDDFTSDVLLRGEIPLSDGKIGYYAIPACRCSMDGEPHLHLGPDGLDILPYGQKIIEDEKDGKKVHREMHGRDARTDEAKVTR